MPDFDSEKSLRWMCEILGNVSRQEGRFEEAEQLQSEVVEARRRLLGEEHLYNLNALADLGLCCRTKDIHCWVIEPRRRY